MHLAFTVLAEVIFLLAMQLIFLFCLLYVCFILCVSYFDVLPQNLAASCQRNIVEISLMPYSVQFLAIFFWNSGISS